MWNKLQLFRLNALPALIVVFLSLLLSLFLHYGAIKCCTSDCIKLCMNIDASRMAVFRLKFENYISKKKLIVEDLSSFLFYVYRLKLPFTWKTVLCMVF